MPEGMRSGTVWKEEVRADPGRIIADMEKTMGDILGDIGDFVEERAVDNINDRGISDTGFLAGSSFVDKSEKLRVTVGFSAAYASPQEYGRRAGFMPPVKPIMKWCMRKLHLSAKEAERRAWAVARKIERDGMEPKAFFRDALTEAQQVVPKIIAKRVGGS